MTQSVIGPLNSGWRLQDVSGSHSDKLRSLAIQLMSTSPNRKYAFFGPYITTPDARDLQARLMKEHFARLKPLVEQGVIKLGGPVYTDGSAGDVKGVADRNFGGSFFILETPSYDAAMAIIKDDVYYLEGLWDVPNLHLVEYIVAFGSYPF
ncbi:hypothetical protein MIND_00653600 [Mycena indigotica]|uniref:YCII-related domain-containing protein n=1 Tax=Mycena indigotica TaxID=2126181 RepID=A0A8H6W3F8_9AGAR|nr:uncharacterized protein MIND_00653600 [Mycena indigotica]KAF7304214.1 hypothetical protein MIND_00653600 [Mycena indigotica]